MAWTDDDRRNRRLLFGAELLAGTVRDPELAVGAVREAVQLKRVPATPSRAYQRWLLRRGDLSYMSETLPAMARARRAVLGTEAGGPPRLLVRAEALPEPPAGDVPALLAVDAGRPLADAEVDVLVEARRRGAVFALHAPEAELAGRSADALAAALDAREAQLGERAAIRPEVLVADGRVRWRHWPALAERYAVVCAGAHAVRDMGYHHTPLFRGEAVWMPVYAPFHGTVEQLAEAAAALGDEAAGAWVPAAVDGPGDLGALAPWATSWEAFLEAVRLSR